MGIWVDAQIPQTELKRETKIYHYIEWFISPKRFRQTVILKGLWTQDNFVLNLGRFKVVGGHYELGLLNGNRSNNLEGYRRKN